MLLPPSMRERDAEQRASGPLCPFFWTCPYPFPYLDHDLCLYPCPYPFLYPCPFLSPRLFPAASALCTDGNGITSLVNCTHKNALIEEVFHSSWKMQKKSRTNKIHRIRDLSHLIHNLNLLLMKTCFSMFWIFEFFGPIDPLISSLNLPGAFLHKRYFGNFKFLSFRSIVNTSSAGSSRDMWGTSKKHWTCDWNYNNHKNTTLTFAVPLPEIPNLQRPSNDDPLYLTTNWR